MDIRHLRYFVAAVEQGSLQGAAQRMNVAQPALSRRIRDMELRLGCELLTRGARGVSPTRAGASFYRDALRILEGLDDARHRARRIGQEAADVPNFGVIVTARKFSFIQDAMRAYTQAQPQTPVTFARGLSPDLANALRERRLDVSLLYEWRLGTPGIQERLIHYEQYVLATHPDHPLAANPRPIRLAELSEEPLVWFSRGELTSKSDVLMRECQLRGLDPMMSHIARTHDEQIDLAVVSRGAFITTASILRDIHRDFFVFRPLAEVDMEISLSMAWNGGLDNSPAQDLLDCLHAAIDAHQQEIDTGTGQSIMLAGQRIMRAPQMSLVWPDPA